MRVRYNFSSRHTGQARDPINYNKKKKKFPDIAQTVLDQSDIVIQILDARFTKDTRNLELEQYVKNMNKKLIHAINKSDLVSTRKIKLPDPPYVIISCKNRTGIKKLRDKIKQIALKTKKDDKITVGVLGYPNIGKSSVINLLIGKKSAPTGAEAGFTKGLQKLRLTQNIQIFDSPGVIPKEEYSTIENKKIAKHAKVGSRTHEQVKDPEAIVAELFKEYSEEIQDHYHIKTKDSEKLIEKIGRQKNFLKKGNEINFDKTSRSILKDFQEGKIKL